MEARELRCFVAVAEELHFGDAARRLKIAPGALSRTVRKMENDLGVELFRREGRGVTLTEAGGALAGNARNALARFDEAVAATRETGRLELTGSVRVGVSPLMRHRIGPAIFERFAETCPGVTAERREALSGPLVEECRARRIDVALAFLPPRREDLAYTPIGNAEIVLLISSAHRLAGRGTVELGELEGEPLLVPSAAAAPEVRRRFGELFTARGLREPRYSDRATDHDEEMTAVREGAGAAVVSRYLLAAVPKGTAMLRPDPPIDIEFEMVRRNERAGPATARFIETVEALAAERSRHGPAPAPAGAAVKRAGRP